MDVADSSIPGCYLLVVVGEPYSEDHKKQILQKLSKGLLSWDVEAIGCDLSELENVCSNVKPGSEPENELLIQHSNETLAVEVLSNPQVSTLKQCLKNLLLATTGHKHLIYAGYSFKGTGSWILQNGTFSFANFVEAFEDADVQKELNSHVGCTIHVHCIQEGEWTPANVEKHPIQKLAKITLNPPDKIDSLPGSSALIQCLESVLVTQTLEEMMTLSPLVGNIRFNRPTLYVFPGGQGDCALFGINGFNMLVDGGFNRKPCFWEFIRHLDRLDAVMVTRLCESNVCGITTMMKRKAINNIFPQIGYVFCNVAEGKSISNDELSKEKDDLLVSVLTEGHSFLENLTELKMKPHRCLREATNIDPFTLYQKVGHGRLEMYTLSPQKDSKEVKEFLQQWASCKENFSRVKTGVSFKEQELSIPLSHAMSICSLVVWRPANPEDTITRIFFPGSAPQNRIFEGLEKLKTLDILKQPVCSHSSLHPAEKPKPKIASKGLLTKNNVTSLASNGIRRSSESLGSKKDATESKPAEKITAKAPVKKDISKSPPEPKKKEVKQPPTAIKKEVKEKKSVSSPKPVEVKKTSKLVEANKSAEPKTKGLKEVTNKKTVDAKVLKRKPEAPKPKPASAPKATPKPTKPSAQSPKHVPKTTEPKKITTIKSVKSPEKKKENKLSEEKRELPKEENLKEPPEVKPLTEAKDIKDTEEQICEEKPTEISAPIIDNDQLKDIKDNAVTANEIANEASPKDVELEKEKNEVAKLAENTNLSNKEEISTSNDICGPDSSLLQDEQHREKISAESELLIESNDKFVDNSTVKESEVESTEKLDNNFLAAQQQSATDLFLATASMEGSMHEGLIDNVEDFNRDSYIQKEAENYLRDAYEKEMEDKLTTEEIIEEKSEKESLHDVMVLGNDEEDDTMLEGKEKIVDSATPIKEYEEKYEPESEVVKVQQEELLQEAVPKVYDNQYVTENETVTVHCEEVSVDNVEPELASGKKSPVLSSKANLSVDIVSYSDDDDDIVKSPTPVAIVDYKDEESLETYKVLEDNEKYIEDGPENEKASKEEEREPLNDEQFDVLMLETEKPSYEEEKESSSFSEDEKDDDDDDEEMIRHPTPPGEQNFYGKIGTSDMPTNVEELDTRFMEHYLPVTRQTPDSCQEPLYEEIEDECESDSESPIVEQPVYSNVVQADYPEFVNISGGTTPSEPQSPKSVHDSKHRLPDASEVLFKDTPPQESDEDRFEEEQKRTLTEVTSHATTEQEYVKDEYKDVINEKKEEQKEIDKLLEDEDFSVQDMKVSTRESYDLDSTQVTTGETENILPSQEFDLPSEVDSAESKELLICDNNEMLNRERDVDHQDNSVMEGLPLQQEPIDEYSSYSNIKEHSINKADHLVTETDEHIAQYGMDDSSKFPTSTDLFGSHGMDQSFHESYIETEETAEPMISSSMDQSFHESYLEREEPNEQIISRMDQSFHESYIETEKTSGEPLISRMDQSFHESYIETGDTNEPVLSRMDQSFHESYIDTEKLDEPIIPSTEEAHGKEIVESEDPYSSYIVEKEANYSQHSGIEDDDEDDIIHSNFGEKREEQNIQHLSDKDIKETEKVNFGDSEETFSSQYDREQHGGYAGDLDERVSDYSTTDNYHKGEKDGSFVMESYHREEKERDFYKEEREEDESYITEKYGKGDRNYSDEAMEEGYYGDNERSQFADYDCTTQRTTYSYQSTISSTDSDAVATERKELLYSTTTNGVNLPRDINGHETDMWKDKELSNSFRNHEDGYDKSPGDYYNDEQDLYRGMSVPDPAYAGSDFKTNDIIQRHYMDTASVDDILLERKETSVDKTYSSKDYHQEQEDSVMLDQYSEHVAGLQDIQKESSTGFRLEDWSKPLGLPSPPESKTTVKSATKPSSATKTTKLDKKPKVAENGKAHVTRASPKIEKTNKLKTNGASPPPVYVDLSYVPHHGDPNYCNVEFFRRIRARYYVFSGINPSKEVLNALLEAKKSWKDDSEVTIIPTYETDTLGYWMALNQDSLLENKIDVAPSASRCTVNLQDHETSCAAYRLEF